MAIHPSGTFSYTGKFTEDSFEGDEIVIQIRCEDSPEEKQLVGHEPKIRYWNGRLILDATSQAHSLIATVSYPIGDVIERVVQAGDTLSIARSFTGDLMLNVSRGEQWLLGLGAVGVVLVFEGVTVRGGALHAAAQEESVDDLINCDWIEFEANGQTVRLHERESAEIAGYHIYVESASKDGCPGEAECLSVTTSTDPRIRNAAMRAAILLGACTQWRGGTQVQFIDW